MNYFRKTLLLLLILGCGQQVWGMKSKKIQKYTWSDLSTAVMDYGSDVWRTEA